MRIYANWRERRDILRAYDEQQAEGASEPTEASENPQPREADEDTSEKPADG